jgi:hypothetical protein
LTNEATNHVLGLEARDHQGTTPLLVACRVGNVAVVEHLLGVGANVGARDAKGRGALHIACESFCDEDAQRVCALLLAAGCDVDDAQWTDCLRPDEIAEQRGHKMTTRTLVSERRTIGRARRTTFKRALVCVTLGNVEGLIAVLKQETDGGLRLVRFPGGTRAATLLLDAIKHDVPKVCGLLLERGAVLEETTRLDFCFLFLFFYFFFFLFLFFLFICLFGFVLWHSNFFFYFFIHLSLFLSVSRCVIQDG